MKKKYILAFGFLTVLLIASAFAIWITSIRSTATYNITSDPYGGLAVVQELSGGEYDSLSGSLFIQDEFIFNYDGDENTQVKIIVDTTFEDVDDNCTNWENDCIVGYGGYANLGSQPINEGNNTVTISSGLNQINFNVTCSQYACPQLITPSITIEKIPL